MIRRTSAKTVHGYYGGLQEVTTGLYSEDQSPTLYDQPSPKLGAHNTQSKISSQIAAKRFQIQRWFVLTFDSLREPIIALSK